MLLHAACASTIMLENFSSDNSMRLWKVSGGKIISPGDGRRGCGTFHRSVMHFDFDPSTQTDFLPRVLAYIRPLRVAHYSYIEFFFGVAASGPGWGSCEPLDAGDEVFVQLRIDNQRTIRWETIATLDSTKMGIKSASQQLIPVRLQIPEQFYGRRVLLRWIQPEHFADGYDSWTIALIHVYSGSTSQSVLLSYRMKSTDNWELKESKGGRSEEGHNLPQKPTDQQQDDSTISLLDVMSFVIENIF